MTKLSDFDLLVYTWAQEALRQVRAKYHDGVLDVHQTEVGRVAQQHGFYQRENPRPHVRPALDRLVEAGYLRRVFQNSFEFTNQSPLTILARES